MTTTTYSYFFSSDPANGATPMDSTGSRFIVQLPQPIRFPQCKNIDLVLNSASIWYTQSNISKTLYKQLKFDAEETLWSKNLLRVNGANGYGFFDWDNGFGLVNKDFTLSYNEDAKRLIKFESIKSNINQETKLNFAKAYMQKIFSEYLSY